MKRKLTKKQFKKLFGKELERTMAVLRGGWEKIAYFSASQTKKKRKVWEELQ